MEEPDDNSDFDDLFLPFALSRAIQKQGIQSSVNQTGFETSGEYVDIVLDDDNSSEAGDGGGNNDLSPLDALSEGGDPSSLCPSPSPLSSINPSDSQPDLSDLRRANSSCQRANILEKLDSFDSGETDRDGDEIDLLRDRKDSILDGLLCEIYDRCHASTRPSVDSDGFTECSSDGAYLSSKGDSFQESSRLPKALLNSKTTNDLLDMVRDLQHGTAVLSGRLIKQLKRRDRYLAKRQKNQDVLTAMLQAVSQKRRVDAQLRFSIEPLPGKKAFRQWYDAFRAVARLPFGLPGELRKAVWLSLADKHIKHLKLDWEKTVKVAFNDHSNPDDDKLGVQIVKDLHRTGCSGFCGQGAEEDRVVLKRVLLAYARWNKSVGYCQGFNVIAALILEVMERMEDDALKVMIFLIDHVLPDSYFANNLRALSVDMAVFRELLHFKLPDLAQHLDKLQKSANDGLSGSYEPPLTNVFTMQWFLTLFATCLPKKLVLRVWDTLFLEGSEVLLRVALAIWAKLAQVWGTFFLKVSGVLLMVALAMWAKVAQPLLDIKSADEFYSQMAVLCSEMLQDQLIDGDDLIKTIYSMASFPFPHLNEIREKYMFSITPFSPLGALEKTSSSTETKSPVSAVGPKRKEGPRGYSQPSGSHGSHSDEETEFMDEEDLTNMTCFTGLFPPQSPYAITDGAERPESQGAAADDITKVSPGAYSTSSEDLTLQSAALMERMTMDVQSLKKQYLRIQRRQMRAHVIYGPTSIADKRAYKQVSSKKNMAVAIESPAVVNHLLVGKGGFGKKNAKFTSTPQIAPPSRDYGDDDDFPSKRVHINTKPNVKQLYQGKDEDKNAQGGDDMSDLSSVFEDDDASAGNGRSSSRDDLTNEHQASLSIIQDEKTCSQESLEPEMGSLIDWGSDGESRGHEDGGCREPENGRHLDKDGIGNVKCQNTACSSPSSEGQDLNANDVSDNRPRQQLDSDKTMVGTSTESIPNSMSFPEFNCAIEAFNPNLPGTSPPRRQSGASEPPSPSDRRRRMKSNGNATSRASDHSPMPVTTSWRHCSSGSSSCDEPTTPPARVTFNPFPKRALRSSESRTRTRMKLGLYPTKTNEKRQDLSSPRDGSTEQLSKDIARAIKLSS